MQQVTVKKGRTKTLPVGLGYDVSGDELESEIRVGKTRQSELIATWTVSYLTDGTDGELILTLDDTITGAIERSSGWMDLKRVSNGEPIAVFDEPLEVVFEESVTA
jgi:hypothetical protein